MTKKVNESSLHVPNRVELGFEPTIDYVFPDYVQVVKDKDGNETTKPMMPRAEKMNVPSKVVACDSKEESDIELIHKQLNKTRPLGRFPIPRNDGLLALTREQVQDGLAGRPLPRPGHAYGIGTTALLLVHLPPEHACNGMFFCVFAQGVDEARMREYAEKAGLDPEMTEKVIGMGRMSHKELVRSIMPSIGSMLCNRLIGGFDPLDGSASYGGDPGRHRSSGARSRGRAGRSRSRRR